MTAPPGQYPPGQHPAGPPPYQTNDNVLAMLCHLSLLLSGVGILVPLLVFLTAGTRSAYLRDQSAEALNFHITVLLAGVVAGILTLVLIGLFMLIALGLFVLVVAIVAAVRAYAWEWYRYPVNIRLVR